MANNIDDIVVGRKRGRPARRKGERRLRTPGRHPVDSRGIYRIRKLYKKYQSSKKVAEITGWSPQTILKYVHSSRNYRVAPVGRPRKN